MNENVIFNNNLITVISCMYLFASFIQQLHILFSAKENLWPKQFAKDNDMHRQTEKM